MEGAAFDLAARKLSDEDTRRKPEWDPSAGGRGVQVEWTSEQYRTVGGMPDRECVRGVVGVVYLRTVRSLGVIHCLKFGSGQNTFWDISRTWQDGTPFQAAHAYRIHTYGFVDGIIQGNAMGLCRASGKVGLPRKSTSAELP